jgi:hypothetical protein
MALLHFVWVRNISLSIGEGWGEAIVRHYIEHLAETQYPPFTEEPTKCKAQKAVKLNYSHYIISAYRSSFSNSH